MIQKISILFFVTTFFVGNFVFADNAQNSSTIFSTKMESNLKSGKTNDDIKFLQQTLNNFGYFESDMDNPVFSGKFDQSLTDAVTDFQRSNQIKATGEIDDYTIKILNDFINWEKNQNNSVSTEANPYLDTNNTSSKYSEAGQIHDGVFLNQSALDYYLSKIPGLIAVGKAIDIFFGYSQPKSAKFDIFQCFSDPKCFLTH